jgi:hypothetical protein
MSSSSEISLQGTWETLYDESNPKETWIKCFDYNKTIKKTRCRLCTKKKVYFKRKKKFSLRRHLSIKHKETAKYHSVNPSENKIKETGVLSKAEYIKHCVILAVFNMAAFLLFNRPPFRALTMIHTLKNGLVINNRNIGDFITKTASSVRKMIMEEVKGRIVSIKLDLASRHHRSMLGINIQYYSRVSKTIIIRTLACLEILERHTEIHLKTVVLQILTDYGIDPLNVYCYTSDNGANMICLGNMLINMQQDLMQNNSSDNHVEPESGKIFKIFIYQK